MIIAGTGLMALAINSVFDASGMVTGGFSGIAIIIKAGSQGIIDGWYPSLGNKYGFEHSTVSDRMED